MLRDWNNHPANAVILRRLSVQATRRQPTPAAPYVLDGYGLRAHPDLQERFNACTAALPRQTRVGIYGYPALITANGGIVAVAMGTHGIAMRLPDALRDLAIQTRHALPLPEFGADWVKIDAWNVDAATVAWVTTLTEWLTAAAQV